MDEDGLSPALAGLGNDTAFPWVSLRFTPGSMLSPAPQVEDINTIFRTTFSNPVHLVNPVEFFLR
jgi:hypothetical protein